MESRMEPPASPPAPRPWVAGLFAMVCPGLGHLYCGRVGLAWALCLFPSAVASLPLIIALAVDGPVEAALLGGTVASVVVTLLQLAWAVRLAQRTSGWTARGASVLLGFAVLVTLGSQGLGRLTKALVAELDEIPSSGMVPTLLVGDQVLVAKLGARNRELRRGDIAVFRAPSSPETVYAKRVVAVGGDEVAIRGGEVWVAGKPLPRTPLGRRVFHERSEGIWIPHELEVFEEEAGGRRYLVGQGHGPLTDAAPVQVPEGHLFVLGDNRDNSVDSRNFGTVPVANVVGRAHGVVYSRGLTGVHVERLGLRL